MPSTYPSAPPPYTPPNYTSGGTNPHSFVPGAYYPPTGPPPPYPGPPMGYAQGTAPGYGLQERAALYPDVEKLPRPQAVPIGFGALPPQPPGNDGGMGLPQQPNSYQPPTQSYQVPPQPYSSSSPTLPQAYQPYQSSGPSQPYQGPPQPYQGPPQSYQPPSQSYQPPSQPYQPPSQPYQPPSQSYQPPPHPPPPSQPYQEPPHIPQSNQTSPQTYQPNPQSNQAPPHPPPPQNYQPPPQSSQTPPQAYQPNPQSNQAPPHPPPPQNYQPPPQSSQTPPQSYQPAPQAYQPNPPSNKAPPHPPPPQNYQPPPQSSQTPPQAYQPPQSNQTAPHSYGYSAEKQSPSPSRAYPSLSPQTPPESLSYLKDGETPGGCVVSWRGGEGLQLFFLQQEGHIVSPEKKNLVLSVYKKINGSHGKSGIVEQGMAGVIEVHGCWRLKLNNKTNVLRTANDIYVFRDESTVPARVVILELPESVTKTMKTDLATLLRDMTDMREEAEDTVDKITVGVNTIYSDVTKKLNTAVKDTVPGAHKSTKWLRKGTGNLVRMGGSLVSKGMHFVSDQLPAGEQQQHKEELSAGHMQLMEDLKKYRRHVEEGTITYV